MSPYLLSQLPDHVPKLLLRGVVSGEIARLASSPEVERNNRVVFSGTHENTQGLEQLVKAWQALELPDWKLHIAGHGPLTSALRRLAQDDHSVVFHGLLDRNDNARLLSSAKIGMNPQDPTHHSRKRVSVQDCRVPRSGATRHYYTTWTIRA